MGLSGTAISGDSIDSPFRSISDLAFPEMTRVDTTAMWSGLRLILTTNQDPRYVAGLC